MYFSDVHLDALLADQATYFSRFAGIRSKMNNANPVLDMIRFMSFYMHCGDFSGTRRNFASGWASYAQWSKNVKYFTNRSFPIPTTIRDQDSIIITIIGTFYNDQMIYEITTMQSELHAVAAFNRDGELDFICGDCPVDPQTLTAFVAPSVHAEPYCSGVISHQFLDLLLRDSDTYFSTLPEICNLNCIYDMVIREYIPMSNMFVGPNAFHVGIRENFANGWAETASWRVKDEDAHKTIDNYFDCDVNAKGAFYDNKLVYYYHISIGDDYSSDHLTGNITFDLTGKVLSSEQTDRYDYGYSFCDWSLFECLAPKSVVEACTAEKARARAEKKARERIQFGYALHQSHPPLIRINPGDEGYVAWIGRRANDETGWAKTMKLKEQRDVNPRRISFSRIKKYPESIAEYRYFVTWDGSYIHGKIAFGPDNVIISHKFKNHHTCYPSHNILAMCRPYE